MATKIYHWRTLFSSILKLNFGQLKVSIQCSCIFYVQYKGKLAVCVCHLNGVFNVLNVIFSFHVLWSFPYNKVCRECGVKCLNIWGNYSSNKAKNFDIILATLLPNLIGAVVEQDIRLPEKVGRNPVTDS